MDIAMACGRSCHIAWCDDPFCWPFRLHSDFECRFWIIKVLASPRTPLNWLTSPINNFFNAKPDLSGLPTRLSVDERINHVLIGTFTYKLVLIYWRGGLEAGNAGKDREEPEIFWVINSLHLEKAKIDV